MQGGSHIIVGMATVLLADQVFPALLPDPARGAGALGLALAAAVVGALLPDIDSDDSSIRIATGTSGNVSGSTRRLLRSAGVRKDSLSYLLGYVLLWPVFAIIGLIAKFAVRGVAGGHRGRTHTLLAVALVLSLALIAGPQPWIITLAMGYASHLLADSLTRSGVPLLWPFTSRRFHALPYGFRLVTGTPAEYLLVIPVSLWALYAFGSLVWPVLRLTIK